MISCVSDRCSNQLNYLPLVDRVGVEPTPVDFRSTASTELASDPKRKPPAFHKTSGLKSIYTYLYILCSTQSYKGITINPVFYI